MASGVIFIQGVQEQEPPKVSEAPPLKKDGLSEEIVSLLNYYFKARDQLLRDPGGPRIKVGETFSSVAHAYETLRYAIDYKKEHLLRRNAIERILKRILRGSWEKDSQELSESLIKELIWARYIRNDYYPQSKIEEVAGIIAKYLVYFELTSRKFTSRKEVNWWKDWLTAIASCEIEESLDISMASVEALSFATQSWLEKRYQWEGDNLTPQEKKIQLTIAIHRGLFRSDDARTSYHLLKVIGKNGNPDETLTILEGIKRNLVSPIQSRLYRYVQKQIAAFPVLKDVIEDDLVNIQRILGDKNEMEERIREMCEIKYDDIGTRITRGIVRSIIYIFVTKILFAILIEIPYEYYLLHGISIIPLVTTLAIPILFVLMVAITIKRPGEANTRRITEKIFDFVYASEGKEKIKFSVLGNQKRGLMYKAFVTAYGVLFLLTFSAISWILFKIGFNFVGAGIFFIFLSLVLLFGYRVRFTASELNVTGERESLLGHLLANLSLPLLDVGVWLSDRFAKLNFLIVLLDFLIEAPLKNIIGVADEWTTFVRERREEVIEIPVER